MNKTFLQTIGPALLLLVLSACGSSPGKEDMQKNLEQNAQKQLQKDTPKEVQGNSPSTDGPKEVMSVAAATKYLSAADANKDKLITISAYPIGMTKPLKGEFLLYVSDKTGAGLANENFACSFTEEMKDAVKTHKAGNLVAVTGNIGWNNGMILLKNARLAD